MPIAEYKIELPSPACEKQIDKDTEEISDARRQTARELLIKGLPLRDVCRITGVGLPWLLSFIIEFSVDLPDDLYLIG
jgi:hypothetical protein